MDHEKKSPYDGQKTVGTGRRIESDKQKLPLGAIIVVDDDRDFRIQMELILGTILGSQIKLEFFARPQVAISRALELAKMNPELGILVFTDMQMPGITGTTVGHMLTGIPNIRVIHLSATTHPENFPGEFYEKLDFLKIGDPKTIPRIKEVIGNHFTL